MTDSVQVLVPGFRVIDENGEPVSGAKIKFFDAGTTNPKTVYADKDLNTSLGTEVVCDAGGYPASGGGTKTEVYVDASAYKVVITTSADVTIVTHDNCRGALDTSGISPGGGSGVMAMSVTPQTTARNITSSDAGKLIAADPTSASFVLTLDSAITLGNGFLVAVSNVAASGTNTVTIAAGGSQTIGGRGSITLDPRQTATIVCDGANFHIQSRAHPFTNLIIRIADRLTAPPGSPVAGARYIINGTPTGLWASYAENDIVEWDGVSSWIRWQPTANCGWMAYVMDETVLTQYRGSAWVDLSNAPAPAVSYAKILQAYDEKSQNTSGGTAATTTWTKRTLNTSALNTISGASLASDTITLPTGKYRVTVTSPFFASSFTKLRFMYTSGSNTPLYAQGAFTAGDNVDGLIVIDGIVEVTDPTQDFQVQYYAAAAGTLGRAQNISGQTERYTSILIEDIAALQGPQGVQGTQGTAGTDGDDGDDGTDGTNGTDPGLRWLFDNSTTMADPGSGDLRLNNAAFGSVTAIAISAACGETGNPSVLAWLQALDDSTTSGHKGFLILKKASAPQNFVILEVTANITDNTTWVQATVSYKNSNGSFSNGDVLSVQFSRTGDKGLDGLGAGDVVGPSSATDNAIPRFDATTGKLIQGSGIVIDDSDNLTTPGSLKVGSGDTLSTFNKGNMELANSTAAYIDFKDAAADDYDVRIIYAAGGTSIDVTNVGGTRALKTAGSLVLTDATGLAQGKHTIWIPATAMVARTTNGAAAGTVETSSNKNMLKTLDFDTTTQEFAQFSIAMPKSWNVGTVTFQPVWSHPSTTTNFGVVWSLAGIATSDGDALDAAFGTAQTSTDTGGTTDTRYIGPESSAITIGGSPAAGDVVQFQIARVPSDGSDTMAVDARLHGIKLYITLNASTDA